MEFGSGASGCFSLPENSADLIEHSQFPGFSTALCSTADTRTAQVCATRDLFLPPMSDSCIGQDIHDKLLGGANTKNIHAQKGRFKDAPP
jgi:hypothetical protein